MSKFRPIGKFQSLLQPIRNWLSNITDRLITSVVVYSDGSENYFVRKLKLTASFKTLQTGRTPAFRASWASARLEFGLGASQAATTLVLCVLSGFTTVRRRRTDKVGYHVTQTPLCYRQKGSGKKPKKD